MARSPSRRGFLGMGSGALLSTALAPSALSGCAGSGGGGADKGETGGDSGDTEDGPRAPTRAPEPTSLWAPSDANLDEDAFPFALVTGDATTDSVHVLVRTSVSPVRLRWAVASGDGWDEQAPVEDLVLGEDAVSIVHLLTGLSADQAVCVCAEAPDGGRSQVSRVRTATAPGDGRQIVFGATSCLGGNEPWPSLQVAATENLDFFALLGDTIYADGARSLEDYRLFWTHAFGIAGLKELTANTSVIATWDDHEIDNNWSREDVDDDWFADALQAFRESLPYGDGGGPAALWRSLRWGDTLEVFVLDCRAERGDGHYLSDEQQAWLAASLEASEARFKIILNSVPITNLDNMFGTAGASDRWEGFPEQRAEVLQHIVDAGIEGVLWVSGDVHFAQIGHVDPAGGIAEDAWEVFTGPAGSFLNIAADLYEGHPQYAWMAGVYNWCRFTCDPLAGTILVEFVGDDGGVLHAVTLDL